MQPLKLKILDSRWGTIWPLPQPATPGAAGVDLRAATREAVSLSIGDCRLLPTGLAIHLDDVRYAGMIFPRSGLGHKQGLVMGNTVGVMDSDYQGEMMISCWNRGRAAITINPGERIAQLLIVSVVQPLFEIVENFTPSARADGGFGHTGVN